ncbi:MAG: hypothetical protein ACSLFF_03570 [Solirubrobacterales bacterium]
MAAGGLKVTGALAALLSALVLAGCGDPNAGDAYAAELSAFLDTQEAVVAHDVGGRNDLPFSGSASTSVTLDPSLDAAGVVDASMAIVTHRTKRDASTNDTTIAFGATGAKDPAATTSFYLDIAEPLPDTDRTRARLTSLVDHAGAYVKADAGIVSVTAEYDAVGVETTSDPFRTAPLIDGVLRSGQEGPELRAGKKRQPDLEVMRGKERVTAEIGDDLAWLAGVQPMLQAARDSGELVSVWAYSSGQPDARKPQLSITLRADALDEALSDLEQLASGQEVSVRVERERPPESPAPEPSSTEPSDTAP